MKVCLRAPGRPPQRVASANRCQKFRRSVKGEKDSRPHHISIPPKDAIAIVPPKKVSRAVPACYPAALAAGNQTPHH
jgi:hypothetical protein